MNKESEIASKYSRELMNINNKLNQLENGKIYDLTHHKQDGYLSTNVEKLRENIFDLLYKIEFNETGDNERFRKVFDKHHPG